VHASTLGIFVDFIWDLSLRIERMKRLAKANIMRW